MVKFRQWLIRLLAGKRMTVVLNATIEVGDAVIRVDGHDSVIRNLRYVYRVTGWNTPESRHSDR